MKTVAIICGGVPAPGINLTYEKADQIFSSGGSAIHMSRFKPKDLEFNTCLFIKEGIDLLVTILSMRGRKYLEK